MIDQFKNKLGEFLSGMKFTLVQARLESGDSIYEGNKLTSFYLYKKMCEMLIKGEGGAYLFHRAFFTLEWNLLARS